MFIPFAFFIIGALSYAMMQIFLSITPNYKIFKHTEATVLLVLAELHIQRLTAIKIIQLAYEESDRMSEFDNVKRAIDERYNLLITNCIEKMKNNLPYKIEYSTIQEAMNTYTKNIKEARDVDEG